MFLKIEPVRRLTVPHTYVAQTRSHLTFVLAESRNIGAVVGDRTQAFRIPSCVADVLCVTVDKGTLRSGLKGPRRPL